jgi:integrase
MAWAEQLKSGKWRAVYRDSQGRKRSAGTFNHKAQATREAGSKEVTERKKKRPSADLTWGEWEPTWLAGRTVAASTQRSDHGRIRDHLRPHWQDHLLSEITADDVQQWVAELSRRGLAPSTVTKCYHLLSASMKAAVKARHIDTSPCKEIELPKPGPMPERYLSPEEMDAITAPLDKFDQLVVAVLVGTGMRLGEALALHWQAVDLERNEIRIEWSYDPVAKIIKPPKDYERRVIPIGKTLASILRREQDANGMGLPATLKYPPNARIHSGLVLTQSGQPFDSSNFRKRFVAATRIAYVGNGKTRRPVGHVRPHDLRHTYASRLLRAGLPLEEVSKLLGHASVTTTMRYAHLAQSHWDDVRRALG